MSAKKHDKSSSGDDPFHSREQSRYESPIASREHITSVLKAEKGPMDLEALADRLQLGDDAERLEALRRRVGAMLRDGQLIQNRRQGLVPVDTEALIAGRISAHPDGFGFLIADDGDKDVYLNGKQMRQVLHGDRVVVCITGIDHRGRREGRIVDVVDRANRSIVGRLSIDRGTIVVLPDNKRIHQDLLISPGELAGAVDGDMVVAEIVEQPTRRHQPVGRVVEVLGQHLRPGMEIDVALHSHGIPVEWPDEVIEQAAGFSTIVDTTGLKGRLDVRDLQLITIDGADARDFDDAVWCERLSDGWRLIVAIADVAHYVAPAAPLDAEAVRRGTSVYFPGRVVPMLPEVLSNGLCSLNPDVDRLCMLCEMTLDNDAGVRKARFHNGIMRSQARLTYDQVSEMLVEPQSPLRDQHQSLMPMIEELHVLYKALARARKERGAIEFDSNETIIIFDDNKKIREIVPVQRNDAHKLIEECMILANIQAAAFLEKQEIAALYRVHAGPKADRLEDLRAFLALRDLSLGGGDSPTALDYAALADSISDRPDRSIIQTVMLRSMQQAVYQPKNEGHFGLALEQYAHFTSPIRRYPDLLVHRAIKHVLAGGKAVSYPYTKEAMQVLGESCSMTERRAEEASRDVVAWLKCEYMQDHVGSEFPGVVSAVTSFGLFVDLIGIHIEGLVHVTSLSRDFYRFEQAAQALVGERTGKQYHLGDSIVVQVAAVNLEERKIDFIEVAHESSRGKQSRTGTAAAVGASGGKGQRTARVVAPAAPVHGKPVDKVASPEQRRKEKRRRKQKRRDEKRALRKIAEATSAGSEVSQTARPSVETTNDAPATSIQEVSVAARKPAGRKRPVKQQDSSQSESGQGMEKASATSKTASDKAVTMSEAVENATPTSAADTSVAAKKIPTRKVMSSAGKKTPAKPAADQSSGGKLTSVEQAVAEQSPARPASRKKSTASSAEGVAASGKKVAAKKATGSAASGKKATAKKVADATASGKKAAAKKVVDAAASGKKAAAKKVVDAAASGKKAAAKKVVDAAASGKKAAAKKVTDAAASGKKAAAKKATVATASGKKAAAKKATVATASGKKAAVKKVVDATASGKKAAAKKVVDATASGKKAAAKKVAVATASGKKAAAKKVTVATASGKKTTAKKARGSAASGKNATAKKSTGSTATGKKTTAKKTTGKKASARKVTARKQS